VNQKSLQKILRLIDANINRAMEGLRVVEDVVRLVLDNKKLTEKLKRHRSRLRETIEFLPISRQELMRARRSGDDIGKELYPQAEARRDTVTQIVTSNLKRVEESLRVLEEFIKLLDAKSGKLFKDLRFKLYDMEKEIVLEVIKHEGEKAKKEKLDFDLYVISDHSALRGRSHIGIIKKLIASGIKIIQLRDKEVNKAEYFRIAKKLRKLTKDAGVAFIVNDYVDITKAVDADGVHLGQDDIPVRKARNILGDDKIIGVSTHTLSQAKKAERAGVDYISVGPVFSTPLKPGKKPVGLKLLRQVKAKVKVPIIAIGGINASNIYNVRKTGVKRVAVIRAVVRADNISLAVKRLRSRLRI